MKRFMKKLLAIALVVFQVISLVPTASFAEDDGQPKVKTVNVLLSISGPRKRPTGTQDFEDAQRMITLRRRASGC